MCTSSSDRSSPTIGTDWDGASGDRLGFETSHQALPGLCLSVELDEPVETGEPGSRGRGLELGNEPQPEPGFERETPMAVANRQAAILARRALCSDPKQELDGSDLGSRLTVWGPDRQLDFDPSSGLAALGCGFGSE